MTRSLTISLFVSVVLLTLGVLAAACLPQTNAPSPSGGTPSPTPPTLQPPQQVTAAPPTPGTVSPGTAGLTVWIGDDLPLDSAAGQVLWNAASAFEAANPGARVTLLQKKASGKGGIEDLLTSAGAIAPQTLPDVVSLDLRDLPRYARNGLIQPFDTATPQPTDLYPFARTAAQADGRVFAAPFSADFVHVVYDTTVFTKSAPVNWSEVISSGARYAFAVGGENGMAGDSFLTQYVALSGRFADGRGRATLDRAPLADALELYRAAVAKGIALTGTLALKNEDDTLKQYAVGKALLADTTARGFMRDRAQLPNAGFGALPTRDGNLATIARTWGFGLVARDANRRQSAQRFAEWLTNADHTAAWNRAAGRVPPRRVALNNWSSDSAYREFANQMLGVAVSRSPAGTGASLEVIIQLAIVDVLQNNLSPAEAADKAIAALNR